MPKQNEFGSEPLIFVWNGTLELEIREQETVLDSTDKVSLELESKYSTLRDRIPNLEREIKELESLKCALEKEPEFAALLSNARRSNAILSEQLRESQFEVSENKEKLETLEYEMDCFVTRLKAESEIAIDLQAQLSELKLATARQSTVLSQKEAFERKKELQLREIQKLMRESKSNAKKLRRHRDFKRKIIPEARKLKLQLSEWNAKLKRSQKAILALHERLQSENHQIYQEYEELIIAQRAKVAALRQLKKNFRIEVASLQTIVDRLHAQHLSVREIVSKNAAEIDELKMELRVSQEKARLDLVFHQRERNRMLCESLANVERNHDEIAALFEQNRTVRQQMFGPEYTPKRCRTRIFTNHLIGKQQLRRY
jgi:chromosome segregation ATPase